MRRLIISALLVGSVAALCFGRYISRTSSRRQPLKTIQLSPPKLKGILSFEEALARRRSVRQYANRALGLPMIGQLAWAGQGITDPKSGLRTAPSAGALYPIDLYFATAEGLFVYSPQQHTLEQTLTNDIRGSLAGVPPAPLDIIIAGSSKKLTQRFRDKSKNYMLLEAGHIAQNIQLQAVCLGLGSVTVGGISSRDVVRACRLPKNTEAIYVISIGYPLTQPGTEGTGQDSTTRVLPAAGKKALMIVPSRDYRDDELIETKRVLDMAGVEIIVASKTRGIVHGMLGNTVDAIIFIGGSGVKEYFDDAIAKSIAREAAGKQKVLAAISAAPTILANAGALTGRKATAFMSERDKLQQGGAIFTTVGVERDGSIITCSGPIA